MKHESSFGRHKAKWKPEKETNVFMLTEEQLIKIRGHHDMGSWKVSCEGCSKIFDESDVGRTIVSVPRKKPRHAPRAYWHLRCFNARNV